MQQGSPDLAFHRTHSLVAAPSPLSRSSEDHPVQSVRSPTGKQKKRVRSESACDPVKQQRILKHGSPEDTNASQALETPSLVGKNGGLCSVASVDRLLCMMTYEWHDRMQRPVDLMASRAVFAKIIAATVELDCLFRFLKMGGLRIVNQWLQEVYTDRSPTGKEACPEWDRAAEDVLLAILGALERLPVDLDALKTCSVGRSVNHLRGHKHPDVQGRARKLIEMWKKQVESEMQQTGEARLSTEHTAQLDGGSGGCYHPGGSQSENQSPFEHSDVSRGKYTPVSSPCSTPGKQSRGSSTITAPAYSADNSSKPSLKCLRDALVPVVAATPHPSNAFSQPVQNGMATSTCTPGPCANKRKVVGNTGVSKEGKNTALSSSNTSSDATALSASVWVSKDLTEGSSILDRSIQRPNPYSPAESCPLPCCSFFQKVSENPAACNLPCGSTLISASSCAAEFEKRKFHHSREREHQLCAKPVKTSVQCPASLAISANSTIDVESPGSPLVKSMRVWSPTPIPNESKVLTTENISANYSRQPSSMGNIPAEREQYDRNSSTVSSPSETSMPMDTGVCEKKRGIAGCNTSPSPRDTASETSLSSTHGNKGSVGKRDASSSGVHQEQANVPLSSEKRLSLPLTSAGEAVGESCTSAKGESEKRGYPMVKPAPDSTALKAALEGTALPYRCCEDNSLDAARLLAVKAEPEVTCKQISHKVSSFERSSAPCHEPDAGSRAADASVMVGFKQCSSGSASPFVSMKGNERSSILACSADVRKTSAEPKQVVINTASATRELNRRPDFDLNEILSAGEEGTVQASGMAVKSWGPMQEDVALPAWDNKQVLPIMPKAPVAVVAAANGPFMLQEIACNRPPKGVLGWKGSAATSAFRPTQPRMSLQKGPLNVPEHSIQGKIVLDFDLNIAAELSSFVHDEIRDADTGVRSSSTDVRGAGAASEAAGGGASCGMSRKADGRLKSTWDLNLVDIEAADSRTKLDFDLNNGPTVQDSDDLVLAAKPIRLKDPLLASSLASSSRMPNHSLQAPGAPPSVMAAFAMSNPENPYTAGKLIPSVNDRSQDGSLQYSIFMQNPSGFVSSGMACAPVTAGPFQGVPYGFTPAPLQCFSALYGDSHGTKPQSGAVFPGMASSEPLLPSQNKPPLMMSMVMEPLHQQGMGGFWNRPNFDLNAGPEFANVGNARDDRRQTFSTNEQMGARPQAGGMATALQRRE